MLSTSRRVAAGQGRHYGQGATGRQMRVVWQLAVIAALGGAGGAIWHFREPVAEKVPALARFLGTPPAAAPGAARQPQAQAVEVARAGSREMISTLEAVGTAQANEAIRVTAKITGIVTRISFQDSQKVAANALLVEMDPAENDARLAELRATRDNVAQSFERARALFETRSIPQARVDDLKMQVDAADARIRAELSRRGDTVIRAPFAGKLGLRNISLGALVRPGDVITTLDDVSVIKLDFEAPEAVLAELRVGGAVSARAISVPDRLFEGQIATIDSRVDPVTRSIKVRALLPNTDDLLKPGMLLTTTVVLSRRPNAVTIPEEAVLVQAGEQIVFLVREGKAVRQAVKLGARQPGHVEVLEGVAAGADVVVGGLQQVRNGQAVRPVVAGAPQRPPGGAGGRPPAAGG